MDHMSTVFALSTPVGGAITVMRISGPDSRAVLSRVFTGRIEPRRVSCGRVIDENGETVDTCTAVFYAAPSSYTGEDMAEIFVHGSYAVAARLMELIENTGLAGRAEPGEFTKRAYLNGKLDLAQAEAVMDVISSSAERSRRAAAAQLEGRLSAVIRALYERAKLLCAQLANAMDDDTGEAELDIGAFACAIRDLGAETNRLAEEGMRSRILREGARVAIIGSPNVGKSSLLNALIMRERSIVTAIPGTTRDTVEENASIEGIPVVFVDTAGIREAEDEVEKIGVERARRESREADLVLWLADGTRALNDEDEAIFRSVEGKNMIAVITKADLETVIAPDEEGRFLDHAAAAVSSLTGEGLGALKKAIAAALLPGDGASDALVTNARHVSALIRASEHLSEAEDSIRIPDAAYYELRSAMDCLASILGVDDPTEELVDSIFANFCMGK